MATAADILGLNRKPKVAREWADHYRRLCEERDRLLDRDCSAPEAAPTKLDDITDAAAEEWQRGMSMVAAGSTHEILVEIVEAIRRIERGTYGTCELTGQPIESERLDAIPWARFSLQGQNELERDGMAPRIALPALDIFDEPQPVLEAEEAEAETEAE